MSTKVALRSPGSAEAGTESGGTFQPLPDDALFTGKIDGQSVTVARTKDGKALTCAPPCTLSGVAWPPAEVALPGTPTSNFPNLGKGEAATMRAPIAVAQPGLRLERSGGAELRTDLPWVADTSVRAPWREVEVYEVETDSALGLELAGMIVAVVGAGIAGIGAAGDDSGLLIDGSVVMAVGSSLWLGGSLYSSQSSERVYPAP